MLQEQSSPSFRVFISSRMAELSRDRAVLYRALATRKIHPVLFEREPQAEEIDKIEGMMERCSHIVGMYYLTRGQARPPYSPLTPIEYELLGYLALCAQRDWKATMTEVRRHNDLDFARKHASDLIEEVAHKFAPGQCPMRFLLKPRQGGFDSLEAEDRRKQDLEVPDKPSAEEVLGESELSGSLIEHVLMHEHIREHVLVYHSMDALFKLATGFFKTSESQHSKDEVTFQFSLHGPDFTGLLSILCDSLFQQGINIQWIHQTAANGLFLVALTVSSDSLPTGTDGQKVVNGIAKDIQAKLTKLQREGTVGTDTLQEKEVGKYRYTITEAQSHPTRRTRIGIAASNAPGILAAVTSVLSKRGLNIEEISVGPEQYRGIRQSHIRITVSHAEENENDRDFWGEIYNSLINTIGAYGVVIRPSWPSEEWAEDAKR